ncbi:hypothetical protein LXL04_000931 [Taraxacum kok-saghyz]
MQYLIINWPKPERSKRIKALHHLPCSKSHFCRCYQRRRQVRHRDRLYLPYRRLDGAFRLIFMVDTECQVSTRKTFSTMPNENKQTKRKQADELTPLKLKWVERNYIDIYNLQKSLKKRPWILHDQIIHSKNLNSKLHDKVTSHWHTKEPYRPELDNAPYIAKIRPEAEEYGICSIIPPDSWQPKCPLEEKEIWENSRFQTHIQPIDELQNIYSKRELKRIIKKMKINKTAGYGSDCFQFENGPEFTLQTFKKHADDFEANYFQKKGLLTEVNPSTPTLENIEGEY